MIEAAALYFFFFFFFASVQLHPLCKQIFLHHSAVTHKVRRNFPVGCPISDKGPCMRGIFNSHQKCTHAQILARILRMNLRPVCIGFVPLSPWKFRMSPFRGNHSLVNIWAIHHSYTTLQVHPNSTPEWLF